MLNFGKYFSSTPALVAASVQQTIRLVKRKENNQNKDFSYKKNKEQKIFFQRLIA